MKGKSNITRALRFSNISNGDSNKDNPRFGNPKVNNKENLTLNNHKRHNIHYRFSNGNHSIFNPRVSNTRKNHNTHNLEENLKEEMKSIESRMIRSLETSPSILANKMLLLKGGG